MKINETIRAVALWPLVLRVRVWWHNLHHWKTARAVRDLERAFHMDDGFVLTWKSHIAMTLIDRGYLPRDSANEASDELMRQLFSVKQNTPDEPTRRTDV